MTNLSVIELPRLEGERAERYQARVAYITAGADRSLRDLARKLGKSLTLVGRWSAEDDWPRLAADYDQTVYTLAANDAAEQYRADLADYRKRYAEMGKGLYAAAGAIVSRLAREARTMELGPGALALAANAAKTAADLEALALRVEHLLNNEPGSE